MRAMNAVITGREQPAHDGLFLDIKVDSSV